jgi:malate dehydrogenase (oxaloacetate-decarboxylating)
VRKYHILGWQGSRLIRADGEEILGIGDQGCGGILISIAKLVLMTICAGIHPNRVLPVVLDCGTDNETLLNDPLYLGLKERRVRGERYDELVTTFVKSARELFPKAYIHFEDFGFQNGESNTRLKVARLNQNSTTAARQVAPGNPVL